ncbi:MAG: sulfatase-like hydrolase/transferase, partial [Verrucomicrobiota bacterium]
HLPEHRGFEETFIHGGGGIGQMEDYYGNDHLDDSYWHNGNVVKTAGFSSDVLFDHAMAFIDKHQKKPFFCFVSTPATHKPWKSHPEVAKRITERDGNVKDLSLLSMIENIDDNVGRALKQLDELGLSDKTLVIFATDQGMRNRGAPANSPENPRSKSFDERHHVFCMMRYPPVTQSPRRNDALTGMVDMAPTILDLCELPIPQNLDGRSLKPLLAGKARWSDDRELIVQCPRSRERKKWNNTVVKTQRWRLIDGDKLYDLENGDAEVSSSHPEVLTQLNASYDAFWNSLPEPQEILSRHLLGIEDTRLNGMDWYQGASPWGGGHMNRKSSGIWAVEVAKDARYRFELRRYPREASKAIGASQAALKIGDRTAQTDLSLTDDQAVIELNLEAGSYDLEATFSDTDDATWGAYFLYVSMAE